MGQGTPNWIRVGETEYPIRACTSIWLWQAGANVFTPKRLRGLSPWSFRFVVPVRVVAQLVLHFVVPVRAVAPVVLHFVVLVQVVAPVVLRAWCRFVVLAVPRVWYRGRGIRPEDRGWSPHPALRGDSLRRWRGSSSH